MKRAKCPQRWWLGSSRDNGDSGGNDKRWWWRVEEAGAGVVRKAREASEPTEKHPKTEVASRCAS